MELQTENQVEVVKKKTKKKKKFLWSRDVADSLERQDHTGARLASRLDKARLQRMTVSSG